MRLSVMHHPFVERLNSLQEGLSLFPCFVCLFTCLFDKIFELIKGLTFLLNLVGDRIGSRKCQCGITQEPPDRHPDPDLRPIPHDLASPKRRIDTKLPANPSPTPTQ